MLLFWKNGCEAASLLRQHRPPRSRCSRGRVAHTVRNRGRCFKATGSRLSSMTSPTPPNTGNDSPVPARYLRSSSMENTSGASKISNSWRTADTSSARPAALQYGCRVPWVGTGTRQPQLATRQPQSARGSLRRGCQSCGHSHMHCRVASRQAGRGSSSRSGDPGGHSRQSCLKRSCASRQSPPRPPATVSRASSTLELRICR